MYKKLSMVCILLVVLFSLISCSTKSVPLSFDEWITCTIYCAERYCTTKISVESLDPNGYPVSQKIINKQCVNKCSKECVFSDNEIVKEWRWLIDVYQCGDVTNDNQ